MLVRAQLVSWLLVATVLARPAIAGATDESAITSFIASGLANASTHYVQLRGELVKQNDHTSAYRARENPDEKTFRMCVVYFFTSQPSSDAAVTWHFQCDSTLRHESTSALFAEIEPLVRSSIPDGYSSAGAKMSVASRDIASFPYEVWSCAGSASIILQSVTDKSGSAYYSISTN